MMKNGIVCVCIVCVSVLYVVPCAHTAEKRGFIIAHSQEDDRSGEVTRPTKTVSTRPAQQGYAEGFVEDYAQDKEVERLRRVIVAKQRHVTELEKKLVILEQNNEKMRQKEVLRSYGSRMSYEVKKGDSLWRIAGKSEVYNNPRVWMKIYSANMDRIKNPDLIYPGQMLNIPE